MNSVLTQGKVEVEKLNDMLVDLYLQINQKDLVDDYVDLGCKLTCNNTCDGTCEGSCTGMCEGGCAQGITVS